MKRQIHAYRGHGEIAVEGHNIKLGRGGIREIEFFVQTQQLIAGGRHPELRGRDTLDHARRARRRAAGSTRDARDELTAAYRFLRTVEHRLQMVADEQTHTLPAERDGARPLRALSAAFADRDAFAEALLGHLRKVQRHYARLFEEAPGADRGRQLVFPGDADDRETLDRLAELGFRKPLEASATVRGWLAGGYRVAQERVARAASRPSLLPVLLEQLARDRKIPTRRSLAFDRFLAGLHGGGAAVLAAAAESRSRRAGRAHARHRAAARRYLWRAIRR